MANKLYPEEKPRIVIRPRGNTLGSDDFIEYDTVTSSGSVPTVESEQPVIVGNDWETPVVPSAPSGYKLTPVDDGFIPNFNVPTGMKKLLGIGGEERYQLWPEKMIRSGLSLPGDVAAGKILLPGDAGYGSETTTIEPNWLGRMMGMTPWEGSKTPEVIERAMDTTGLMGGTVFSGAKGAAPMIAAADSAVPSVGIQAAREALRQKHALKGGYTDITYHGARSPWKEKQIETDGPANQSEFYSTPTKELANEYAGSMPFNTAGPLAPNVMPLRINSKNYHVVDAGEKTWMEVNQFAIREAKAQGKDGVIIHNVYDEPHMSSADPTSQLGYPQTVYITFNPGTVRSANAAFNPSQFGKNGLMLSDTGTPGSGIAAVASSGKAPVFYSALERAITNINQKAAPGDQWLGTLRNAKGVKPEELEWTGVNEFLKDKPNVTKQELQDFINQNKVELKEVNKGGGIKKKFGTPEEQQAALDRYETARRDMLNTDVDAPEYRNKVNEFQASQDALKDIVPGWGRAEGGGEFTIGGETKYSSYQLPGGENYREMLLTLPEKKWNDLNYLQEFKHELPNINTVEDVQYAIRFNPHFAETVKGLGTPEQILAKVNEAKKAPEFQAPYKSSHWDEPNILAHVRMNDRVIDGKKSLHLEEIQSDWHQQGRDKGYKSEGDINKWKELDEQLRWARDDLAEISTSHANKVLGMSYQKFLSTKPTQEAKDAALKALKISRKADPKYIELENKVKEIEAARDAVNPVSKVPDAPFKKTWHELALKRMIREAAEKGYDRLSWTPGEAQAARYDLSKTLQTVRYDPETKLLQAWKKGNSEIYNPDIREMNITPDKLPDYIGKEGAEKLLNQPLVTRKDAQGRESGLKYHILEGQELKVGGEGMKGFYDQIIPKSLEKIGKEFGVKVKIGNLINTKEGLEKVKHLGNEEINKIVSKGEPIFYIDIPQSMRDTVVGKGQPLFSGGFTLNPVDGNPFENKKGSVAPGWPGNEQDKIKAMNIMRLKQQNQPIEPEALKWFNEYMDWIDRTLPPINRK